MTLAYRYKEKRAHHISYLTHKWAQGEKAANTCLSQVSFHVFMTSNKPREENQIVT